MTEIKHSEEQSAQIPFEATIPALHFRLTAVETGQREIKEVLKEIPERTAELVTAKHPTREECAAQHQRASEIPWGKIAGTVLFVASTAFAAWLGIPVQWISTPGSPPPISATK